MVKNQVTGYGVGAPRVYLYQPPINQNRAPTTTDVNYNLGQIWLYNGTVYCLSRVSEGAADWEILGGSSADVSTLTGNSGGPVSPTDGNINVLGDDVLCNFVGSGSSLTYTPTAGGYPPSQYVIGPPLFGGKIISGYQSIQEALDTLNGQFGPFVFLLQPGWYNENLDFSRTGGGFTQDVHLIGLSVISEGNIQAVAIQGIHTLPDDGFIAFENINFINEGDNVFVSAGGTGGTHSFTYFKNCCFELLSDYLLFLPNWEGRIDLVDCGLFGTDFVDGVIDNTGGSAPVNIRNSVIGASNTNIMKLHGAVQIQNSQINCPLNFGTGSTFDCISTTFNQPVQCLNDSTGTFELCNFSTGASPALTMSSNAAVSVNNSIITSSNNPAIDGAGAGTLSLGTLTFTSNTSTAGTLTIANNTSRLGPCNVFGNVTLGTAGNKISIATGANASVGTSAAMVAGTVTVNTTAVTASSIIFVSANTPGGTAGILSVPVGSIVAGTSFVINSSSNTDTSTVNWWIVN